MIPHRVALTVITCLTCWLTAAPLTAQSRRTKPRAKPAMWSALQLTDAQQARVSAIHDKYAPATKAVQKWASDSSAHINDRELAEVRGILTMQQQEIFDTYTSGKVRVRRAPPSRVGPAKITIHR